MSQEDLITFSHLQNAAEKIDDKFIDEDELLDNIGLYLQAAYPIGAIYMSVNSPSPATLFGFGTWEQIQDTFLLAAGETYKGGATGGEATHTLNVEEMPEHYHTAHGIGIATTAYEKNLALRSTELGEQHEGSVVMRTANAGGGKAHNNMPPYLAVYVWKRTS